MIVAVVVAATILWHDRALVRDGSTLEIFWLCNVSAVLMVPALLFRSALLVQVTFTWLFVGTVVWLIFLFALKGTTPDSSPYPHIAGCIGGLYGGRRWGAGRFGAAAAVGYLGVIVLASRLLLPAQTNINAAHGAPPGFRLIDVPPLGFYGTALLIAVCMSVLVGELFRLVHGASAREESTRMKSASATPSRDELSAQAPSGE